MMKRVRAADDFEAIRIRLAELHRERANRYSRVSANSPSVSERNAAADARPSTKTRVLSATRRSRSI
jgi:hypothetical protein